MPRGRKPKTIFDTAYKTSIPVTTVQDRIKAAEKALLAGVTERVLVSDDDLEKIVSIIGDQGFTKAYILKRAVHLGLQVMSINPHSDVPEPEGRAEVAINKAFEDIERIHSSPYVGQADVDDAPVLLRGGGRWRDGAAEGALPEKSEFIPAAQLGAFTLKDDPEPALQEQDGTPF